MILLTRLGGTVFALNQDLIERADRTPDTVITLVDGTKYIVQESLTELVDMVRQFRAAVLADAQRVEQAAPREFETVSADSSADVVPFHRREH